LGGVWAASEVPPGGATRPAAVNHWREGRVPPRGGKVIRSRSAEMTLGSILTYERPEQV
jgi:hypothetical protein